jgi:hypothetical protein
MSFVMQLAVDFNTFELDRIDGEIIESAILTWTETPGFICPLMVGEFSNCWQDGNGVRQDKPEGCAEVRIPDRDWRNGWAGGLPHVAQNGPQVKRLGAMRFDVTEAFKWQSYPETKPIGAGGRVVNAGEGFMLTGWPTSLDQLTAEDDTVCVSNPGNVKLNVTYTVVPGGPGPVVR